MLRTDVERVLNIACKHKPTHLISVVSFAVIRHGTLQLCNRRPGRQRSTARDRRLQREARVFGHRMTVPGLGHVKITITFDATTTKLKQRR